MSNSLAHRTVAALVTGVAILNTETKEGKQTLAPVAGSILAAICTNLPDKLEPAIHPHHRQFFHSVAFAALVGGGMYKLSKWETETEMEKLLKICLLVVGGSYLIHLAMDACTRRSLPMLGKI
jgi:membrane-bound metal-dependent hydrolase YbcI (DUF457 family)